MAGGLSSMAGVWWLCGVIPSSHHLPPKEILNPLFPPTRAEMHFTNVDPDVIVGPLAFYLNDHALSLSQTCNHFRRLLHPQILRKRTVRVWTIVSCGSEGTHFRRSLDPVGKFREAFLPYPDTFGHFKTLDVRYTSLDVPGLAAHWDVLGALLPTVQDVSLTFIHASHGAAHATCSLLYALALRNFQLRSLDISLSCALDTPDDPAALDDMLLATSALLRQQQKGFLQKLKLIARFSAFHVNPSTWLHLSDSLQIVSQSLTHFTWGITHAFGSNPNQYRLLDRLVHTSKNLRSIAFESIVSDLQSKAAMMYIQSLTHSNAHLTELALQGAQLLHDDTTLLDAMKPSNPLHTLQILTLRFCHLDEPSILKLAETITSLPNLHALSLDLNIFDLPSKSTTEAFSRSIQNASRLAELSLGGPWLAYLSIPDLSRAVLRSKSIRRLRLSRIDDWSTTQVNLVVRFLGEEKVEVPVLRALEIDRSPIDAELCAHLERLAWNVGSLEIVSLTNVWSKRRKEMDLKKVIEGLRKKVAIPGRRIAVECEL
ncbi:hypothetical protein BJ742DRAFT_887903 [Cladochytrium replicatum]|nr:hypothetical protein BJ742DRAFT_887903 [Cladochytrium replicatum]